jgi:hypothetical protein
MTKTGLLRDTASRKRVDEALDYLDRNLHGMRFGTASVGISH